MVLSPNSLEIHMFTGLSKMLQAIFAMFTKTAEAGENFASGLNHVAKWTDDTAAAFAAQAAMEREQKAIVFAHNLKIERERVAQLTSAVPMPTAAE